MFTGMMVICMHRVLVEGVLYKIEQGRGFREIYLPHCSHICISVPNAEIFFVRAEGMIHLT